MVGVLRVVVVVVLVGVLGCVGVGSVGAVDPWPVSAPVVVCGDSGVLDGPSVAPAGAVVVGVGMDLGSVVDESPAGSVFWLAPGVHVLGGGEFAQVVPKVGDVFVGGPGAVLDGRGVNRYAFGQGASDVRISYVTVRNFVAPRDEGVVNHDSASGWVVEHSTIENNGGAGVMGGPGMVLRWNCFRGNGQYGFQFYRGGDGIGGIVVDHNEVTGNNVDDWERRVPGCGCTGGAKFWAVDGATITSNWIHDNHGPGLWADTNDRNFVIEGNLIEGNDGVGLFYEISYNAVIRGNTFRGNGFVDVPDGFPSGAIYISESGGDVRVDGPPVIDIVQNWFVDNHDGVVLWENADRFCNSPNNTSSGYCTLVVASVSECTPGVIDSAPAFDDCRWKTQNVSVRENLFEMDKQAVGCSECGRNAIIANWGTDPSWSPYQQDVVRQAITFEQNNTFADNTYTGDWSFYAYDESVSLTFAQWSTAPYYQDTNGRFRGFGDVSPTSAFADAIYWLHDSGITAGCDAGGTRFCPDAPVTRGQMAAFLVRALSLPASSVDRFVDDQKSGFNDQINALASAGITGGCSATKFCPNRPITREEMAGLLVRAYGISGTPTTQFQDVIGSPFETQIGLLAESGITAGCGPHVFCPHAAVTRGQMAAFLYRAAGSQ
jgi:parallel beta-helix repeat protein